jgi:hypothetical protein
MSRMARWFLLAACEVLFGCVDESAGLTPPTPDVADGVAGPPLQTVRRLCSIEGLPPIGGKHDGPKLLPGEAHLLVTFRDKAGALQAAVSRLESPAGGVCRASPPVCLTCGRRGGSKFEPFEDGRRLWFVDRSGGEALQVLALEAGTTNIPYSVLECSPSLIDCQQASVLPVQFPIDSVTSLPEGAQNREAQPDAYGEYVMWNEVRRSEGTRISLGRLERRNDRYVVVNTHVVSPAYRLDGSLDDWLNGSRFYENSHEFPVGNRYLAYRTTGSALNYDIAEIDLLTGERRFVTRDIDYNELNFTSPDGRLIAYSSARGLDRMDLVSEPRRPPLLDFVAFGQVGRPFLFNNRLCMNELWLMDRSLGQTADGYGGQPLILEDDWFVRDVDWYGDSRRLLVTEYRAPQQPEPMDPTARSRYSLLELPTRAPTVAPMPLHLGELDWTLWSRPSSAHTAMAGRVVLPRRFRGQVSGEAMVVYLGNFLGGYWQVTYRDYSDDGENVLDGSESLLIASPILASVWTVDLRVQGRQNGRLRGHLLVGANNFFQDSLVNTVEGSERRGIPVQAECPGRLRPPLSVQVLSEGDKGLLLQITARVPEDPKPRPVWGAALRWGGVQVESDERGQAWLPRPPASLGLEGLQVEAGGFTPYVGAAPS